MNHNALIFRKKLKLQQTGLLSGLRAAVKDNIAVCGMPMTCASRSLENFVPGYSAHSVERILDEGVEIVGKTNLDEFAMGSSTEFSIFGPTRNPFDKSLTAGGSSGGSAASVALSECDFALGSDSGGSVRIPAAFCSIIGLKPSYGKISRYGLTAFAPSFDHIGILARDIDILRRVFAVVSGKDRRDGTSSDFYRRAKGRTIAFLEYMKTPFACEQNETINSFLKKKGIEYTKLSFDMWDYVIPVYQIISSAEMSSCLARYDGSHFGRRLHGTRREELFGDEVKRRLIMGTYVLSRGYGRKQYERAGLVRRMIAERMSQILQGYDFLVLPTSPLPPFKLGRSKCSPIDIYKVDILTAIANMGGFPAISVPIDGFQSLQIIGGYGRDEDLIDFAKDLILQELL